MSIQVWIKLNSYVKIIKELETTNTQDTKANWIIRKKLRNYWNSIFFGLNENRKNNQN